MSNITTGQELRDKIEAKRYDTFTFPVLEITIKYRKPDLLKLSLTNSLPAAMADAVITGYQEVMSGTDPTAYKDKVQDKKVDVSVDLVKDVSNKSYVLLSELCVSHKILDVPLSDTDNNLIAWCDIPEEDAIAFLVNLINKAQVAQTTSGGEISSGEIVEFPDGKPMPKRNSTSKGR